MERCSPDEERLFFKYGSRCVFKAGEVSLECESGILWITWPCSGDIFLKEGETISIKTGGIICITSMSESVMKVISIIPEYAVMKKIKGYLMFQLFSLLRDPGRVEGERYR